MSVWMKLAYDLPVDMHIPSEPNIRNMSAVKMVCPFKVRCDLCLWNAESKIVVENCLLVLRTAFSLEDSNVLKKNWHRYTQTHINTDTHKDTPTHTLAHTHTQRHTQAYTHTDTQTPMYTRTQTRTHTALHRHTHTQHTHILPTNIDHHTAEFLKAMSQLCDGIQCRLTARTAGSTEGEILAESWKRSKQTE